MKRDDIYYRALCARDHRFDGKFYVGVKTTGIYCRPICPAKPKRQNTLFFNNRFEAENAGFRACLRCRPESAPHSPVWLGKTAVVRRALKILHEQESLQFNEDQFADLFGVSARHLRRLFLDEIGKTPKQISFENRLGLARKLLTETQLAVTEIAFAAGFESIRRFNDAFKERFKRSPRELRRAKPDKGQGLKISLPYRPPFDFEGLLMSYRNHRVGNLEWFENETMHRVVSVGEKVGQIRISNDPKNAALVVEIDFPDTSAICRIVSRVRHLFDLDSDPIIIANCLEGDPKIKRTLVKYPGIRLPSGWEPFEIAISTILGQLVSLDRGRGLVHDLIEIAGSDSGLVMNGTAVKLFPTPLQIIRADLTSLKTTSARRQTLVDFSKAVNEKRISLEPTQNVENFIEEVMAIKGIGIWTANYMALKALRHTDALPSTDLVLARALERHSLDAIAAMGPWRGYVAALLWRDAAAQSKTKQRS